MNYEVLKVERLKALDRVITFNLTSATLALSAFVCVITYLAAFVDVVVGFCGSHAIPLLPLCLLSLLQISVPAQS